MAYNIGSDRSVNTSTDVRNRNYRVAIAVTPSDTKDVTDATGDASQSYTRGLYIGVAGDVTVIMASDTGTGTSVTFKAVPLGILPIEVRRVKATGTAATNIVGLYDF